MEMLWNTFHVLFLHPWSNERLEHNHGGLVQIIFLSFHGSSPKTSRAYLSWVYFVCRRCLPSVPELERSLWWLQAFLDPLKSWTYLHTECTECTEQKYMDVSENSGTPKSSILIVFSIINHPFWGTPIFGNTHMSFWIGVSESELYQIYDPKKIHHSQPTKNNQQPKVLEAPKNFFGSVCLASFFWRKSHCSTTTFQPRCRSPLPTAFWYLAKQASADQSLPNLAVTALFTETRASFLCLFIGFHWHLRWQ